MEQGLEIRFYPFLKSADVNSFLKRGELDVAIAGDMPTLTAATVSDAVVVAQNTSGFNSIVANHYISIRDLKGKRIGCAFGSSAHYSVLQILSSEGIQEKDVHLVDLNVNEMPDALNNE